MKDKILEFLVDKQEEYVSGEELSRFLGITRAAIWKHIESLRADGYIIESQTRLGHRFIDGPLNPFGLRKGLMTETIGRNFVVCKLVDSTNNLAKELAKSGAETGTVVIAEMQAQGKGRRGRSWVSPSGGLWMSVILRPKVELKDAACYTLLAGVAAARGLHEQTGAVVRIKWPNDLLLNGKKIGGILTEVQGEWQAVDFLVIGIGINVNVAPEELAVNTDASSVLKEIGHKSNLVSIAQGILSNLERLQLVLQKDGFSVVLEEWRKLTASLNCEVIVQEQTGKWIGHSVDVTPDGSLLVRNSEGELVQVYSADVSIRSKNNNYQF